MPSSGSGTGTPVGVPSNITTAIDDALKQAPCVSFKESLNILRIDYLAGAYGMKGTQCDVSWSRFQRDGWLRALREAEATIQRDIGLPLCPQEFCDEIHQVGDCVQLNYAPIAYLGQKSWSSTVTTTPLVDAGTTFYIDLCESDITPATSPDDVRFFYPLSLGYDGPMTLQAPSVTPLTGVCEGSENGWRFTWREYELGDPSLDTITAADLIDEVSWQTATTPAASIYEAIGVCGCASCSGTLPTYTVKICDAKEGLIDVKPDTCKSRSSGRVRINYAISADCSVTGLDPDLAQAVVYVALVNTGDSAVKPCGCDNRWTERLLEVDPGQGSDFASKWRYGSTVAGMSAMRIIDRYANRPVINRPSARSGGFMTARKLRMNANA